MVEVFETKKNPFLRIKQLWGAFNAYPDFPLSIKNEAGETVGCLDPDYYFRSFEMFDRDIINNITVQTEKNKEFIITPKEFNSGSTSDQAKADVAIMNAIKDFVQKINDSGGCAKFKEIPEATHEFNKWPEILLELLKDPEALKCNN